MSRGRRYIVKAVFDNMAKLVAVEHVGGIHGQAYKVFSEIISLLRITY
ncbi:BnaC01g32480D [Brassica napus]|uniref:BnaC01g32480D protein n=1 Tax=Brassica napus TaxID=3708 RepID=A0A078GLY7_BRANA|nr:BnaC01g32480D [Brassica napus]